MNVTPKTMAQQVRKAAVQRSTVVPVTRTRLAFTSNTGDSVQKRFEQRVANCASLRKYGEHVLDVVLADLPGDRSVGYCQCGEYIDTLTWDERNA